MSCKLCRTANSAACNVPLYHWYEDPAAVYEEFYRDKQWQNYLWKRKQKSRIKERGEAHLLTPFTAELLPQEAPKSFLHSSDIDIIFEVLDEMPRRQTVKLYIYYINLFHAIHEHIENVETISFRHQNFVHEAVCNPYLNENTDTRRGIERMVEREVRDIGETLAFENLRAGMLSYFQTCGSVEDEISLSEVFQRECVGALSRNSSEKYLLDEIPIGNKNDVKNKIFSLMEILSVEERLAADEQQIWNAYLPEICRKITHMVARDIKNEQKALKLMQDTLGKEFVEKLIRTGHVCVKGKDGNDYQIGSDGKVYRLPEKKYICLMTEWEVPMFDEILAKYLFLRDASEEEIESAIEDARRMQLNFQRLYEGNPETNYLEERRARRNASYELDLDGRIVDISLEEQGERVN